MTAPEDAVTELDRLNEAFAKRGSIDFVQHRLGGTAARLATGGASCEVMLHGAHVVSYRPANSGEVMWLSPDAKCEPGRGIRGGVPVCWPWFATHATDPSKPDHGFVRKTPWLVYETSASPNTCSVTLGFETTPEHAKLWHGKASLSLTVQLSDHLRIDLETINTGNEPFDLSQALHTYFAISDIEAIAVAGLDGADYLDKLQDNARCKQTGKISISAEIDRIYQNVTAPAVIEDAGAKRKIRIANEGSSSCVVWNPWVEKSTRLTDMPPGAYRTMVCVETTNAGGDVITLNPRDSHRLSALIGVEPI